MFLHLANPYLSIIETILVQFTYLALPPVAYQDLPPLDHCSNHLNYEIKRKYFEAQLTPKLGMI